VTAKPSAPVHLLADHTTPLIRSAWYVVARSDEVTREPRACDAMETSLVLYRNAAGQVVALQNRCCHRSFPLAHGKLEGDAIRCGYHGLLYAPDGRCIEIPMQKSVPASLRVRAYPVVERKPFVWAWFGPPDAVDPEALPHPDWLGHAGWDMYIGYLRIDASYIHLHENLLDLSHLSFLHATTFGTPEYARAPVELDVQGTRIEAWRHVECHLPDIYSVPLGWQGQRARRSSGSCFVAPGLHVNTGYLRNLEGANPQPEPTIRVAQVITPIDRHSTHYWFAGCRNFVRGRPDIDDFMCKAQFAAFAEDQFAMQQITRLEAIDSAAPVVEAHIPTDAAGIAMRRHLAALAARDAAG